MRLYRSNPFRYRILVRYSEEDEGYIAHVPELKGCSAWGKSECEAVESVKEAASAWLESATNHDIPIPLPVDQEKTSGNILLRLPQDLHRELKFMAKEQGTSLNQYLLFQLSQLPSDFKSGESHSVTKKGSKGFAKKT